MRRKLLIMLLIVSMVAAMFSGCSSKTEEGDTPSGSDATPTSSGDTADGEAEDLANSGEVEKIVMFLPTSGKTTDLDQVLEAVNKITREKINVEIAVKAFDFGQWFQQYSLFLSGTEDFDILVNYGGFANAIAQGAATDITDLLQEYGQDIIATEGDFLQSGNIGGIQYAIPVYGSYAGTMGIIYRADVVKELGLEDEVANVKSLADWDSVMEKVKESKPNMTPFVTGSGGTGTNFTYGTWDNLGNAYGVLMDGGATSEVTNLFETDEYEELCGVVHGWYTKGYTSKDIQTQTDGFTTLTQNDTAFSTLSNADFNSAYYNSTTTGKEIGVVMIGEPFAKTYNNVTYTVMSTSEHPDAAVKFMNLWFSNDEVANLMRYGIEGVHYQLNDAGIASYLEGQDSSSCTYHMGTSFNNAAGVRWDSENPNYAKELIENNENAKKSVGCGFTFDATNVINEITQLDNVCSKYRVGLEVGALDPEENLPKFIEELKSAGIDTVIAEKQKQMDAWLASK